MKNTCVDCGKNISFYPSRCVPCSIKKKDIPIEDIFLSKIKKTETCWIWTGPKAVTGYGLISKNYKKILTHRFSYEFHKGPIPYGKLIMHSCDNPPCINPDHLSIGTNRENQLDSMAKGRRPKGENHWNSKLSSSDVLKIRELNGIISHQKISNIFGVNRTTISDIVARKHWVHI